MPLTPPHNGASSSAYTQANCVRGLMLATSAARELEFWFSDEWQRPAGGSVKQAAAIAGVRRSSA